MTAFSLEICTSGFLDTEDQATAEGNERNKAIDSSETFPEHQSTAGESVQARTDLLMRTAEIAAAIGAALDLLVEAALNRDNLTRGL